MGEAMRLNTEQLVALITESSWGVPVRDMEALLDLGEEAVHYLIEFLAEQDLQDLEAVELLWPVVVLGEMGDPRGVTTLLRIIKQAAGLELPVAAAEGLAKAGEAAVQPIERLLQEKPDVRTRSLLYASLSRMDLPEAWQILGPALETDAELNFVVARALAERHCPEDLERIHGAYLKAEPWKRSAMEETMVGMIIGRPPWEEAHRDWRLRYRRQPRQTLQVPLTWPAVLFLMWEARQELRPDAKDTVLLLDQLRQWAFLRQQENRCEECGRPLRSPTGIPLCDEVEEDLIIYQLERARAWIDHKWEDIHEIIDELDHQEMDVLQWPEESDEERTSKGEALDAIDVVRRTLYWMVEEGCNDLAQGEQRLSDLLNTIRTKS